MSIFDPVTSRWKHARTRQADNKAAGNENNVRFLGAGGTAPWLGGRRNAFQSNCVVYRCVRMIAEAGASMPVRLQGPDGDAPNHHLVRLLRRPNAQQSGIVFREMLMTHLILFGNAYIEIIYSSQGEAEALYLLHPRCIRLICDNHGWPLYYDYQSAGKKIRHDVTATPCPLIHLRLTDPENDQEGLGPMHAARLPAEIHSAANQWNKSLFENAARPSGALVYRGQDGAARLTDAQFDRLKQELQDNFQGTQNAGRPLLLEGGLDWARISMSPQDMDFIAAKHSAARDIALAFGVPPMLLGIPGDNAYANYAEANRAFWRQTVLPLAMRVLETMGRHLLPDGDYALGPNLDDVPALADERRALWQRIEKASFLTVNEKRALVGFAPLTDDMAHDAKLSSDAEAGQ